MLNGEAHMIGDDGGLPIPTVGANVVVALAAQENQKLACGQTRCLASDAQWWPVKGETQNSWRSAFQNTVNNGECALPASMLPRIVGADTVCNVRDSDNGNNVGMFGEVGLRR